jgi:hypothetical protein
MDARGLGFDSIGFGRAAKTTEASNNAFGGGLFGSATTTLTAQLSTARSQIAIWWVFENSHI